MAIATELWCTDSDDPYFNLAVEQYLYTRPDTTTSLLLFYVNRASVVIGRNQNPWLECDLDYLYRENIPLVRRISGGGAVFHDSGNLNYSFIAPQSQYCRDHWYREIIAALRTLDIQATRNDRNDLVVHGKKVSGAAFRFSRDMALHHGTLLINAELARLRRALASPLAERPTRVETGAVRSVRSSVANIVDFAPHIDLSTARECLARHCSDNDVHVRIGKKSCQIPAISEYADWLSSWEWLYGRTPDFKITLSDKRKTSRGIQLIGKSARSFNYIYS